MAYRIVNCDLLVRAIPAPRIDFKIGDGQSLFPEWLRGNVEVRLALAGDDGREAFGCAADWPSVGWLDKRLDLPPQQRLTELLELIESAREVALRIGRFSTAFECWWRFYMQFQQTTLARQALPLCRAFAAALIERAVIDASCRIEERSFFEMLREARLGFQPTAFHADVAGRQVAELLPAAPTEKMFIRHTVGLQDPLSDDEIPPDQRIDDGLPQSLESYLRQQQISYFKIKVSGEVERDLPRLEAIWSRIATVEPKITLDGNEAFFDTTSLETYVDALRTTLPDCFARVLYLEQPLSRAATLDFSTAEAIARVARKLPLIIDEADGEMTAFRQASQIGYRGVSHKNCKGIFKSLANWVLCAHRTRAGEPHFISGEDLTSLPMVALQQDFAVAAAIGLEHVERNGHHYFGGLDHLTTQEIEVAKNQFDRLYAATGDGPTRLRIEHGQVDLSQLQCAGLGVASPPDWNSMTPLAEWKL